MSKIKKKQHIKQVKLNISLIYNILESYEENIGPNMDAVAIALIKNLHTTQLMKVGSLSSFAKEFQSSSKRIRKAIESNTGKMLLDYNPIAGTLRTNKVVGLGYNVPFIIIEDDIYDNPENEKLRSLSVKAHKRNADVKIPVKKSLKKNLSYIRKQLHKSFIINHLIKSFNTHNIYINNQNIQEGDIKHNLEKYGVDKGLFEGVSIKQLSKVCGCSVRTTERIVSEILKYRIFKSIGRECIEYRAQSEKEAYSWMMRMKELNPSGVYYVTGCNVKRKMSNRYEFCYPELMPRLFKVRNKSDRMKNIIGKEYPNLILEYHLKQSSRISGMYSTPDIDFNTLKRDKETYYILKNNKNIDLLKEKSITRKAHCVNDSRVNNTASRIPETTQREFFKKETERLFHSILDENRFRSQMSDMVCNMGSSIGITPEESRRIRNNTHMRLERTYMKYRNSIPFGEQPVTLAEYILIFNNTDKKIKDQFPISYKEYVVEYSYRHSYR